MKLIRLFCLQLILLCFISLQSFAQAPPTPDEAFRVVNFFYQGKGYGIVLTESKICRDIYKSGPAKYECQNEIIEFGPLNADGSPPEIFHRITPDESVYIWMSFLVPQGAEEKVYLRFNLAGETKRTSSELTVKGALRYRTWTRFTPTERGDWEIEIFHDQEIGPQLLGSFTLSVQ